MNKELSSFATRLREIILSEGRVSRGPDLELQNGDSWNPAVRNFDALALELFELQFKHNSAYRKICEARRVTPQIVEHWTQIPAVPTAAFKELDLTSLAPGERAAVFHSSGTTEQKPSRHFHSAESLAVYEASLWTWFVANVASGAPATVPTSSISDLKLAEVVLGVPSARQFPLILLTPPPETVPHSSLVQMFETVRRKLDAPKTAFVGQIYEDGAWTLNFEDALAALNLSPDNRHPSLVLGTAFSFVHMLDYLVERDLRVGLPAGSRVMETGGYKNRSRTMPKAELHALITDRLGVPRENILCEYGMSELSSQAYDSAMHPPSSILHPRVFRFPPWARAQIISPETGLEVSEGETGLIRIFDLANVFSVAAIQTEDLGIRCGDGFELIGRAQVAEPRGCSLMTA